MILTNKNNLPEMVIEAIKGDPYHFTGDISCSSLFDEPQIRMLRKKHSDEIVEDASDRVFSLLGQIVHGVLERSMIKDFRRRAFMLVIDTLEQHFKKLKKDEDKERLTNVIQFLFKYMEAFFPELNGRYIYEIRLEREFEGMVVSGQFDVFDTHTGILYDYKLLSTYSYMHPHTLQKFTGKMNFYALLLRDKGYDVKGMELVLIFRDYSSSGSLKNKNYPKSSIITVPVEHISEEDMIKTITHRVNLHKLAESGEIVPCSGIGRWASGETWKIRKIGVKNALSSNHVTEQSAVNWLNENKHMHLEGELYIDYQPGENRRCSSGFCNVSKFCNQYSEILKKLNNEKS